MRYRATDKSLPKIARELGATVVVEGSVQLENDQIRITAQLVEAATDRHLWADEYIVRSRTSCACKAKSRGKSRTRSKSQSRPRRRGASTPRRASIPRPTGLSARHVLPQQGDGRDTERGLRFLHEAVDRDPGDALAQAGLALGYATLGHGATPQVDAWPRARAAALRAVALDPNLAEGYAALADVKLYMEWDWGGAEQAFRRANEISPSLATESLQLLVVSRALRALGGGHRRAPTRAAARPVDADR